jgi:hypothetical protein
MSEDPAPALTPTAQVADPAQTAGDPEPAPAHPNQQDPELRCTLCGLRACWTA